MDSYTTVKDFKLLNVKEAARLPCNDRVKKILCQAQEIFQWVIIGPSDPIGIPQSTGQIYGMFSRWEHANRFLAMLQVRQRMGLPDNEKKEGEV